MTKSDFAKQIRLTLEHLHDYAALQKLPLTTALSHGQTRDQSVRQLRNEILAVIEQMKPPSNLPPRAVEWRSYMLLYGRYVQGMSTGELVEELAISVRQLRREQTKALSAVTVLMWDRLADKLALVPESTVSLSTSSAHPKPDTIQTEAERLISESHIEDLSLPELVETVLNTLVSVAAKRGVEFDNQVPQVLPPVRAARIVLRQGLLGLVNYALNLTRGGSILIVGECDDAVRMTIRINKKTVMGHPADAGLEASCRLIASFAGRVEIRDEIDQWETVIHLPLARGIPILVMDDNAGMVELFRRYLSGHSYHVVEARSADQAIQVARESKIRLVILDVLMPQQDGWEVLQRLRVAPETRHVPIMICSALDQPDIAYALGASDYLTKPVTQDSFMAKVECWCATSQVQGVSPPE
jgi:CheY-like chemotaxis protein